MTGGFKRLFTFSCCSHISLDLLLWRLNPAFLFCTSPPCCCKIWHLLAATVLSPLNPVWQSEMRLHRLLLTGCMNCTRMYLPFSGKFCSKRLLSSVSACSSRMDGTRTITLWTARAALCPMKYTVPLGTRKRRLYSKSYSDVGSKALCCHTSHVSRCQPRRCQSAAERNEKLLEASATWPGENTGNYSTAELSYFRDVLSFMLFTFDSLSYVDN